VGVCNLMRRSTYASAVWAVMMMIGCIQDPELMFGDGAVATGGRGAGSGGAGNASGGSGSVSVGSGGQTGTGGTSVGSGGQSGTGATGGRGSGGAAAAGGRATGGSVTGGSGVGGRATGGSGTGGTGTGGAPVSTACGSLGTAHNGNGSFTFYYFGQGTAREGNGFRTACGYFGTENGQTDTVQNVSTPATYFAAIPGVSPTNFNSSGNCGACAEVTGNNGTRIVVTIVDECPQNSNPVCNANPANHLDLSVAAFNQLGFPVGNPSGTTWRFVPCPVSGNVRIRVKTGNPNEAFVENSILAIRGVSLNGTQATRQFYGAWHFNGDLAVGQSLLLTDAAGRTITVPVASIAQNVNQDTGRQFPTCQ
jgi:Lytic transglycolase